MAIGLASLGVGAMGVRLALENRRRFQPSNAEIVDGEASGPLVDLPLTRLEGIGVAL
jgi:hypothetical protein